MKTEHVLLFVAMTLAGCGLLPGPKPSTPTGPRVLTDAPRWVETAPRTDLPEGASCAVTFLAPARDAFPGTSFLVRFVTEPMTSTLAATFTSPGAASGTYAVQSTEGGVYEYSIPSPIDGTYQLCTPCEGGCGTWLVDNVAPPRVTGVRTVR